MSLLGQPLRIQGATINDNLNPLLVGNLQSLPDPIPSRGNPPRMGRLRERFRMAG